MTSSTTTSSRGTRQAPRSAVTVDTASGWTRSVWVLLVVLCGALFLDGLDISMVGVALPSIGADLGMAPAQLQWIVSGYVLGYGGLLLLGGRSADLLGRRQVFLAAVLVFGLASVASAAISNDIAIIALRFVKGVAAAFTVPAGLSIITTTFAEGPARNRALSMYTVCGASGFSLGLVFGGLLTELGWRATFLLPGPVALLLVVAGWRVVPRVRPERAFRLRELDALGAVTITAALLLLVYTVVEAPGRGWASPTILASFAVVAGLVAGFVVTELRHPAPLVRLGILRSADLVHANMAGAVMFGCYASFQFLVTLYLQNSLGWSPLSMALAFLPAGLLVVASSTRIDRVLARVRTQVLIALGLTFFLAAYALFLRVDPSRPYVAVLLPTIVLLGAGFAVAFPSINSQATAGVAHHEQGLASGLVNTSVQVGGAIMMAVTTAILGSGHQVARQGELLPNMRPGLYTIVGLTVVGVVVSFAMLRSPRPAPAPAPVD